MFSRNTLFISSLYYILKYKKYYFFLKISKNNGITIQTCCSVVSQMIKITCFQYKMSTCILTILHMLLNLQYYIYAYTTISWQLLLIFFLSILCRWLMKNMLNSYRKFKVLKIYFYLIVHYTEVRMIVLTITDITVKIIFWLKI